MNTPVAAAILFPGQGSQIEEMRASLAVGSALGESRPDIELAGA